MARRPTLTAEQVAMLREAIDSHIYWQLSDEQYRHDGNVEEPGSDDEDTAAQITAYKALAAALDASDPCAQCGVTHSAEHECEPLTTYDEPAPCPECKRSNGPHYRGTCPHGARR